MLMYQHKFISTDFTDFIIEHDIYTILSVPILNLIMLKYMLITHFVDIDLYVNKLSVMILYDNMSTTQFCYCCISLQMEH